MDDCQCDDCSGFCECQCSVCQDAYEAAWIKTVNEKNLCVQCGIPRVLSIESLWDTQYSHFFSPCQECKEALASFLTFMGLCSICRNPLIDGTCVVKHQS